jgi:hypothetical protein
LRSRALAGVKLVGPAAQTGWRLVGAALPSRSLAGVEVGWRLRAYTTSSMVMDVSAMLVPTTILRVPAGGMLKMAVCSCVVRLLCRG